MSPKKSKPARKSSAKSLGPDLNLVEDIARLMEEHGFAEFEWQNGGDRLSLKKSSSNGNGIFMQAAPQIVANASRPSIDPPVPSAAKENVSPSNHKQVPSPLVGTFYIAPTPGASPYVTEGKQVKVGDVLCIVEAMKLMNEIEAEFSGRIVSILVENGQPVEFGEPLFVIEVA